MSTPWKEVEIAQKEKRFELVISGAAYSERIEKDGLDPGIFKVQHLNFLEITDTSLNELSSAIGLLVNLSNLDVSRNALKSIPPEIGMLKKIKFLNVSRNEISELPSQISELVEMQSLNASCNKLSSIPSLNLMHRLVKLNICHNQFTSIPLSICDTNLIYFMELIANNNAIKHIPQEVEKMTSLKILDLGDNAITEIGELGGCSKIKELNLKGNKFKDNRLKKLIDQCHTKQVLEYIRTHCTKGSADNNKQAKSKKKTKQNKKQEVEEVSEALDELKILYADDELEIISSPNIVEIRPYIVCCKVLDVNISDPALLKEFITLQTKLHKGICEERTVATIATHDFSKINGKLFYAAKPPEEIKILPLNRKKEMSAEDLYARLNEEADTIRKEKKKNTFSGIHKYLYLLKDKPLYPCLSDSTGTVISFPPITNSEGTKISSETKVMLLEVTGNKLNDCKKVMDTLLRETLKLGVGQKSNKDESEETKNYLTVQQVKVVDEEGKLKVVYPSRLDISEDGISVIRA